MAHDPDADLVEYVGADKSTPAVPKSKAAPRVAALAPGQDVASPAPAVAPVAVYTPPAKGASHPKVSRLAVARKLDEAEAALNAASLEVMASRNHLSACEHDEAEAHARLIALLPAPSADFVHRQLIAREQASKLSRVQAGLAAVEPKAITARSEIDRAAANRPRATQQSATTPLRSPVVRR
jgi:hypothetical protein